MKNISGMIWSFMFFIILAGCSSHQLAGEEPVMKLEAPQVSAPAAPAGAGIDAVTVSGPSCGSKKEDGYKIRPVEIEIKEGHPYLPVGAEFVTEEGKVDLGDVIKALADHKGFSVSWADDVNQQEPVDCYIKAADDFYGALDNILRQLGYFYEIEEDTIVVKYKMTETYYVAMPLVEETFNTEIGGDLLGQSGAEGELRGKIEAKTKMGAGGSDEGVNMWQIIEDNLTKIIEEQGSFVVDRPVGLVTVTAPRKTHRAIKQYLENLKEETYRQVIIEAKIIEVQLNESSEMGIDWSDLLGKTFSGSIEFGESLYPNKGIKFIEKVSLNSTTFDLILHELKEYGDTRILSNPKISLLNGHGATITVGENIKYIDSVETDFDEESGFLEYTVNTLDILSGVGMGVIANIINNEEVILYIVPIISELQEPIEYRPYGLGEVGLPRVKLRQMATLAKVKSGQTLIIGGLISKTVDKKETKVPILGDIPFLGHFFQYTDEETIDKELVVFLKPRIVGS